MNISAAPSLYNQSILSNDDFVANFVARKKIFNTLCRRLKINCSDSDGNHQIIIGSRGMGKTSLLRRFAIEINRDPDLSKCFIPLVFREEQYNVLHLRDFWKNCAESLAEWAEAQGYEILAERLDEKLCSGVWTDDDSAADSFLNEMKELGKRAVLMVDNLDLILDALKDQDHWKFRNSLQLRNGPIIVGAATQPLTQTSDRDAAFYEFFHPTYLEPLDLPETERCMRSFAKGRGSFGQQVLSILQNEPARLRVLHRLTGGNPRVLALIYRFLETTDTHDAMGDLERLLDEVTPYYKARIEEYQTPLQRATIDAIALNWDPITTARLVKITGVQSTTLSAQLSRLRKDGLIEVTETSGSYSGYQITERFLNIWYLMRHGTRRNKQRMRWLVAFLSTFYSSIDLGIIYQAAKSKGLDKIWTKDYADAFSQAQQRAALNNERLNQSMNKDDEANLYQQESTALKEAKAMLTMAITFSESGDAAGELATYDALIARFGNSTETALLELVAMVMLNKGFTLGESGDATAELATYDAIIARFGDSTETALLKQVAKAMLTAAINLSEGGDAAAELALYDDLIARFGDSTETEMLELVARAMLNKAITFGQSGNAAAELATYEEVIARFGDSTETAMLESVAKAMLNKAITSGQSGDVAAELAAYDALITRFEDSTEAALLERVTKAMLNKAITFGENGDIAAELATYEDVIARFSDSTETAILERVARAMLNKGFTLGQNGDAMSAIGTYDALIARFGDSTETALLKQVAKAMLNKGFTLDQSGDAAAELAAYDALITRFENSTEAALLEPVARAMLNKGFTLGQKGDAAAELATYDALIALSEDNPKAALLEPVAMVMLNKGAAHGRGGDMEAELAAYDALIARFGDSTETELLKQVAMAILNKGAAYGRSGDMATTVKICDALIARFGDNTEATLLEQVAKAMLNKGVALGRSDNTVAEIATYDAVITRFGNSSEPMLLEQAAMALAHKGRFFGQSGDTARAIENYDQAIGLLRKIHSKSAEQAKSDISIQLGNMLFDNNIDKERAEKLFLESVKNNSLTAYINLFWLYLFTERTEKAKKVISMLPEMPQKGRDLINAALAIESDNFGKSSELMHSALSESLTAENFDFTDDFERIIRLSINKGFGEKLASWFEDTRFSERYAPIYVALVAALRGEKTLLDSNPEVRDGARKIYARLTGWKADEKNI